MKVSFTLLYILFFLLSGFQLKAQTVIYYGYGSKSANSGIMSYNIEDGSSTLCIDGIDQIGEIAIDNSVTPKRIYFIEKSEARIRSVNTDGTGIRDVVTGIDALSALALDLKNRLVYFAMDTDDDDRIYVADMDGLDSNIELLFYYSAEDKGIKSMAVDETEGKLYWIRGGEQQNYLLRSDLDGKNYEMFTQNSNGALDLYAPNDLSVGAGYVFWSDPGMGYDKVNRLSVDGKGFINVANRVNVTQTTFDAKSNKLYMVVNEGMGQYKIKRSNIDGSSDEEIFSLSNAPVGFAVDSENEDASNDDIMLSIRLGANRPNPFSGSTLIEYSISSIDDRMVHVNLAIFDMLGSRVKTIVDEMQPEGDYTVEMSAENLSEGLYFYQLKVGDRKKTRKMMVRR